MPVNLFVYKRLREGGVFLSFDCLRFTLSLLFSFALPVLAEHTSFEPCLLFVNSWGTQCSSLSWLFLLLLLTGSLGYPV